MRLRKVEAVDRKELVNVEMAGSPKRNLVLEEDPNLTVVDALLGNNVAQRLLDMQFPGRFLLPRAVAATVLAIDMVV